jgi:glycosyltransferase involved in cell wall biosynthesis
LLWSGVFEHRKALHLLLKALAALPPHVKYELHILGRGPLRKRWQALARRLNVEQHCRWLGWLDRSDTLDQYLWADLFVFTSLRDTTGTVLLEALGAGTPVIGLDHQGVADVVTPNCGVKIPVTTPRKVIADIRDTLTNFHDHRDDLSGLSRGARQRAEYYSWDRQGERMASVYRRVLDSSEGTLPEVEDVDRLGVAPGKVIDCFAIESVGGLAAVNQPAIARRI